MKACSGCKSAACVPCRIRKQVPKWQCSQWAQIPGGHGSWLKACRRGVVCKVCHWATQKYGEDSAHHKILAFAKGTCHRAAVQKFTLKRHANCKFHMNAVLSMFGGSGSASATSNGDHPSAPSKHEFKQVIDHVCMHGSSVFQGIPNVGGTKKITQMLMCAANAAQKKDQEFVQDLRSMTLMRDERRTPKQSRESTYPK